MSLYNMVNGFNISCIFILPMLGRKQEDYPRFRDCFVSDDEKSIIILTRCGGSNRNCGYGEEELYKDENFIRTYDEESDSTYGYYEFRVPDKWKSDFNKIINGDIKSISKEYSDVLKKFYPKLAEKGIFDIIT